MPLLSKALSTLPTTRATRFFLYFTLVETLVDIGITAALLHGIEAGNTFRLLVAKDEGSVQPVYLSLFILAHVFGCVIAWQGLWEKNTVQIIGLLLFNTMFLVYSLVVIFEIRTIIETTALKTIIWFIPGMITLTELVYLITIYPIFREFGWTVWKRIGADRKIKTYYAWYQIFLCILKFDYFIFLAFFLQDILLVLNQGVLEDVIGGIAVVATLIVLLCGYFAVRKEKKILWGVFVVGCGVGVAYFIYKLFRIHQLRETAYILVYKSLTAFSTFCLIFLLATTGVSLVCYSHFNRGLKERMDAAREEEGHRTYRVGLGEGEGYMLSSVKGSTNRLSID